MDINQLRCFVVLGDELHFGRAARKLEMMPASLSRFIKLLEDDLGIRLLNRSTRNVSLTPEGAAFLNEAKTVIADFDALRQRFRKNSLLQKRTLRIGAIDSAAKGLLPELLNLSSGVFLKQIFILQKINLTNLSPDSFQGGWMWFLCARRNTLMPC